MSGALAVAPKTEIAALSYREQSVDMKLNAPSLAALSQLSQYIDSKHDLKAEIQSSTPVAGGVAAMCNCAVRRRERTHEQVRTWFSGLQQRERRVLTVGAIAVAVLILMFGLLLPLQGAVSGLKTDTTRSSARTWRGCRCIKRKISSTALPADRGEAPVVVVDRTARETGLTDALRGTAPNGNGVRVQLEAAAFDTMVPWLVNLDENYGLAIESITLDRTARPGLVNASITFTPSRP